MKALLIAATVAGGLAAGAAHASDDCRVPMNEWQPREALQTTLEGQNWQVERIKTDDGCYEVRGTDPEGRKAEAKFDPKTFEMVEWELKR